MSEPIEQTVGFLQGLLDIQLDALKSSTRHIETLRRENAALKRQIADAPSLVTELQDRVSLLEDLLRPTHFDRRLHEIQSKQ